MEVTKKNDMLFISKLDEPRPSATGKTIVIASSEGPEPSTVRWCGKIVYINAVAFVYSDASEKEIECARNSRQANVSDKCSGLIHS